MGRVGGVLRVGLARNGSTAWDKAPSGILLLPVFILCADRTEVQAA